MTEEQFKKIAPAMAISYERVMELLNKYEINSKERIAQFFAQCAHESGNFKVKSENLNYSADGLMKIFPKYFRTRDPQAYARKPEKIANVVYSNRMGNGDEASGDGYKYRGRGYIQLTGKDNYTNFSKSIDKSLDETVEYLGTEDGAIESALWFWKQRNLNKYCTPGAVDEKQICKLINGGFNGLDHRQKLYKSFLSILNS